MIILGTWNIIWGRCEVMPSTETLRRGQPSFLLDYYYEAE
jgi:hypothetical protein